MRSRSFILTAMLISFLSFSQEKNLEMNPLYKKGQMFVFWGWNFAKFTNSDIKFEGNGYDFTLQNVQAHDRQSKFKFSTYFNPTKVTVPQTNYRIGYFIKDGLALSLALDHMKYVMTQNQTVDFKGKIDDPFYASMVQNGQIDLSNGEFLTFEHTDGLNYINIGIEKYKNIWNKEKLALLWSYGGGGGALLPKTNAKLLGKPRSDRFHLAGFGADIRSSLNLVLWKHWMIRTEGKLGYINMNDIKTTLDNKTDNASQDFFFAQINFGIGYTFNTKKNK